MCHILLANMKRVLSALLLSSGPLIVTGSDVSLLADAAARSRLPEGVVMQIETILMRDQEWAPAWYYPEPDAGIREIEVTAVGSFVVGDSLGAGATGEAFEADCLHPSECGKDQYVIKYSTSGRKPHPLVVEYAILRYLEPIHVSVRPVYVSPPTWERGKETRYLIATRAGESISKSLLSMLPHERLQLAIHVLSLLEKFHATGLVHGDLHAGNILFESTSGKDVSRDALVLIDFEKASLAGARIGPATDLLDGIWWEIIGPLDNIGEHPDLLQAYALSGPMTEDLTRVLSRIDRIILEFGDTDLVHYATLREEMEVALQILRRGSA